MYGWLCFPFTYPSRLFYLGCVSILFLNPAESAQLRHLLSPTAVQVLCFHLWLFGCCSGFTFLFFSILTLLPVRFMAAAFFGNQEQMPGSGVVHSPGLGSSGWCWGLFQWCAGCSHCRGIKGLTGYRRQPEFIVLWLYRRSSKGLDQQSINSPRNLHFQNSCSAQVIHTHGVWSSSLLISALKFVGNQGVPCYFFLCFCFLTEISVWQPDSNVRNP